MIKRRGLLTLALTAAVLGAVPGPADARCALLPLAQEIAQSRYVFEGVVGEAELVDQADGARLPPDCT